MRVHLHRSSSRRPVCLARKPTRNPDSFDVDVRARIPAT